MRGRFGLVIALTASIGVLATGSTVDANGALSLVKQLGADGRSIAPRDLTLYGGAMYFGTGNPTQLRPDPLWRSQGTEVTTFAVSNTIDERNPPSPYVIGSDSNYALHDLRLLGAAGPYLYLRSRFDLQGIPGEGLVRSDGFRHERLADVRIHDNLVVDDKLYLIANLACLCSTPRHLWVADASGARPAMTLDDSIFQGPPGLITPMLFDPLHLSALGNTVFFSANARTFVADNNGGRYVSETGRELWRSDGTHDGTYVVRDIHLGKASSRPENFTAVGGTLFFSADDGAHGRELWRTDGTETGTLRVADINPNGDAGFGEAIAFGNTLIFAADDGTAGLELWRSDGTATGTRLIKDINPGTGRSRPRHFTEHDGLVYFTAYDDSAGRELWRTDGTDTGTQRVADIGSGPDSAAPTALTVFNNRLYFAAAASATGVELYSTDGTANGTRIVEDLRPGPAGAAPQSLIVYDNGLYLTADDGVLGRQLWKLASVAEPSGGVLTAEQRDRILDERVACRARRLARRELNDLRRFSRSCTQIAASAAGVDTSIAKSFLQQQLNNAELPLPQRYAPAELAVLDERLACRQRRQAREQAGAEVQYKRRCLEYAADKVEGIGRADAAKLWKSAKAILPVNLR